MESHFDLPKVKVDGSAESCNMSLIAQRMLPGNLTSGGLLKTNAQHSARHIILESYIDDILPVHNTVVLKIAHYMTGRLMPIKIFRVDTKYEVIISHTTSIQLGLLNIVPQQDSPT